MTDSPTSLDPLNAVPGVLRLDTADRTSKSVVGDSARPCSTEPSVSLRSRRLWVRALSGVP